MQPKTYRVTCKKCKNSEELIIDTSNTIYWKPVKHIISGRFRLDMNWGWQCICGNDDLITQQEKREIRNLQSPNPSDITKVLKALVPDKPKFKMELIK